MAIIKRIVRLEFFPENTGRFEEIFQGSKQQIKAFDGCLYLELCRDIHHPNVYYTVSHWQHAAALEMYRKSDLFKDTWAKTKALFSEKPQAYSLQSIEIV